MTEFDFKILHNDIFPDRVAKSNIDYSTRPTVRGVIFNTNKEVCIRTKTGSGFYFLPGGGIEENETPIEALERECLEEVGCNITNIQKIGVVIEYRDEANEKRTNDCFMADLLGDQIEPTLAIGDEDGFDVIWVDINEAIELLENQKSIITETTNNFYSRSFNTVRDLRILQELSTN